MKSISKKDQKFKSLDPISRAGWTVKASTIHDTYLLTIILSESTGQCIVRHFDDEHVASAFVDFVCELDAEQEHDI